MLSHLKSLELHGYKTFASRTLFEFSDRITAIVGPNGSGKSNIADSLRWVLGEQSYSLLRGKKTEDMIFSGSEHRPRAGMASATITFNNEDGWLPIDFNEVAVARRAYRDGQNEYLINGQRVRLKDVSELLAQSGLAERTYTIIGQGLVDAALALKAEERRRLFEEAAGTGLHRARREEALRRLETTQRNLDRVRDILTELQPRLRSLERQARRAQEYEQVKADLRLLLREWYGFHWHRALSEVSEARDVARKREETLNQARKEQAAVDEKLANLRERLQVLRANLNSWHRQLAQLHARRETASRGLAVADERMHSLEQQRRNTQDELNRLEEELALHRERLSDSKDESERLEIELQEARLQSETAREALQARHTSRLQVEKQVQNARQVLSNLVERQGELQARLRERQAVIGRDQEALLATHRAVDEAHSELRAAQVRHRTAEQALQAANSAYQTLELKARDHLDGVEQVEKRQKDVYDLLSTFAADDARLKAQIEVIDQAERALAGYAEGTRLLLLAARQKRLEGAHGALNAHLNVPEEYELAIASALGDYLDAVLLDEEPDQALDMLAQGAVRGVLLPLGRLKPPPTLTPSGGEGVLGVAADLVRTSPELRPVVDLLLGQVFVVQDRKAAQLTLKGQPGTTRAVTLKGEVFHSSGPIIRAKPGERDGSQTVLSRQRQRRELEVAYVQSQEKLKGLEEDLRRLGSEQSALQVQGEKLRQEQQTAREVQEQATQAFNRAGMAVEQAARQAVWREEQGQRLQDEINQSEADTRRIAQEFEHLLGEVASARELLREKNVELSSLGVEEFQAQVTYWETQSAVAGKALEDGAARLRERQSTLEKACQTQAKLQERISDLDGLIDKQKAEITSLRLGESQINGEIEALRTLIEPAENELDGLEQDQDKLQGIEAAVRQTLSKAEHNHAQARINLARRQEALGTLRHRIEDDFGLVVFEYNEDVSGPTPLPLEGMVEQLPVISQLSPEVEEALRRQRTQLRRMGAINPEAQAEYQEVRQRVAFLNEQVADLEKAESDVRKVIAELDELMQREFRRTFAAVAAEFKVIFTRLFGGGTASLVLTDPDDLTETGIDIDARLPGRRTQGLSLLSGGERSLTAAALVFALLKISPTPFCVLDEVDAMLDEANVGRFSELLRELSENTQFVIVTHNRNTVQVADIIYGVTMGRDSSSQVLSLKLDEVSRVVA
jgi:chromosome segregation protein